MRYFSKDYWREIEVGEVNLTWVTACTRLVARHRFTIIYLISTDRCLLPTVNQETGLKDPNQEPWKTLRR